MVVGESKRPAHRRQASGERDPATPPLREVTQAEYCAGGASGDATPDYNSRLAYGTDQGRWLNEQVACKGDAKRRAARPQRAFHDISTAPSFGEAPAAAPPSTQADMLNPGLHPPKVQRVMSAVGSHKASSAVSLLVVLTILLWLVRYS